MSVGEWLDQVSVAQHSQSGRAPASASAPAAAGIPSDDLDRRLEDLNIRLKRLAAGTSQPDRAESRPDVPSRSTPARYDDPARDDQSRHDRPRDERRREPVPQETVAVAPARDPVNERLDELDRRLAELATPSRKRDPRPVAAVPAPERAETPRAAAPVVRDDVHRMRSALREIEELQPSLRVPPPRRPVREAAERTQERDGRAERARADDDRAAAQAENAIEKHFQRLSSQISDIHKTSMADVTSRIEDEIRGLRQSIETRMKSGAVVKLDDREMAEIRAIGTRLEAIAADRHDPRQMDRVYAELARLKDAVLDANVEGSLRSLEAGYGHVLSRLDDLKRGMADPRLVEHIGAEIGEVREALRVLPAPTEFAQVERRIQALGSKLDQMQKAGERSALPETVVQDLKRRIESLDPAVAMRQIDGQLKALSEKIDAIEASSQSRVAAAASANDERLSGLVERLASIAAGSQTRTSEDIKALDRRLSEVAGRIGEMEERGASRAEIAELARVVQAIGTKIDQQQQAKPVIPAGLMGLDQRLERLGERLDRLDTGAGTAAQIAMLESEIVSLRRDIAQGATSRGIDQLEDQIRQLGDRIDRLDRPAVLPDHMVSDIVERTIKRFDATNTAILRTDLQTFESRFEDVAVALERLDRPVSVPETIVADIIERTMQRFDSTSSTVLRQDIAAFENRFEDIAVTLDRMVGTDSALDHQVEALEREVAAMRRDLAKMATPPRDTGLEDQLRALTQRLNTTAQSGIDVRVVEQIEDQIGRIADRMTLYEQRFAGIGGIEAKLGALERLLGERREDALEAASSAAREAVREFADYAAGARQSEDVVRALETDLRRMQDVTRTTESRTSDALQSVHDALATIVSRLGTLEQGRIATPAPAPAPAAPAPVVAAAAPASQPAVTQTIATQPSAPRAAPAAPAISVNPDDHRPLEPGSGKPPAARVPGMAQPPQPGPAMQPPQSLAAQAQAMTAPVAPPPRPPSAAPEPDGQGPRRSDFIAAARRAAQAAAQGNAAPAVPPPMAADPHPEIGDDIEIGPKGPLGRLASMFKGKTKTVAIAGGILIVASGALSLAISKRNEVADLAATGSTVQARATGPARVETSSATPDVTAATTPATPAAPVVAQSDVSFAPPSAVTSTFKPMPGPARIAAMPDPIPNEPETTGSIPKSPAAPKPEEAAPAMPTEKIGSQALRTAAVSGDAKAQFEVGMRFAEGRGVVADQKEATVWYSRAAAKGFIPAAYRLGSSYEKGLGVTRDPAQAKYWYQVAAEGGNIRAMHNLGVLFANERDMAAALPWFQKAADAGLKDSQFNLGIIYALGSGVKSDLGQSYKWFAISAAAGDQEALKKRDDIGTHLDKTALAAAKLAASTWKVAQILRDANEEVAVWVEPTGTPVNQAELSRNQIMQVQTTLQARGLYAGPVDGTLSQATKAAIRVYQKKSGQKQTGEIDEAFLSSIGAKAM